MICLIIYIERPAGGCYILVVVWPRGGEWGVAASPSACRPVAGYKNRTTNAVRDLFWSPEGSPTCRVAGMCFEEFLVFFVCAIFFGVKSKESQQLLQGVRVLLWSRWGEEGVTKVILQKHFAGAAVICYARGRASLKKKAQSHRDYDGTKGYQGEDIDIIIKTALI